MPGPVRLKHKFSKSLSDLDNCSGVTEEFLIKPKMGKGRGSKDTWLFISRAVIVNGVLPSLSSEYSRQPTWPHPMARKMLQTQKQACLCTQPTLFSYSFKLISTRKMSMQCVTPETRFQGRSSRTTKYPRKPELMILPNIPNSDGGSSPFYVVNTPQQNLSPVLRVLNWSPRSSLFAV